MASNRNSLNHLLIATWSDWTEDTQVAGSTGDRGNYRELATISKYAPQFKNGGTYSKRPDRELEAPYIWGQDVQRLLEYKTMGFSDSHPEISLLRNRLNQLKLNIASGNYAVAANWADQARAKRNSIDANLVKTVGSSHSFTVTGNATSVNINIPGDDPNLGKPGFVQPYLIFNYKYNGKIISNGAVNETDAIRVYAAPTGGGNILAGKIHRRDTGSGTTQIKMEIPQNLLNENKSNYEYHIATSGAPLQITGLRVDIYRSEVKDRLYPGDYLWPNQSLTSHNGQYQLVYQGDGNLVVYGPGGALWATYSISAPGCFVLQGDGNAVVYDASWRPVWATYKFSVPGCFVMQDDSNLVQYDAQGRAVWTR